MAHETFSLLVRWVHVAAMALALGGAVLLWFIALRAGGLDPVALLSLAENYERLFWLALGVLVMTGIGNLGAFGQSLPAPSTAWGGRLLVKLAAVLLLFLLSVLRTLVVVRLGAAGEQARLVRWLPGLYGGTGAALALVVLLAVFLAHAR
jgi:hypothetical protein